jgi:drug/metabolite transporter (DMT)-like permease
MKKIAALINVAFESTIFKLNRFHWTGNIIAILGVAIIIGINNIIHMKIDTGFVFSIIASIFLALYVLSVKEVRQK